MHLFLSTILDDPLSGADDTGQSGVQSTPPSAAATEGGPEAIHHQLEGVLSCQPRPKER
jgi:hypothetical protein